MKRAIVIWKRANERLAVEQIHRMVDMWLDTCPNGDWVLSMEKEKKQRSVSQNALMWLWFDVIAKEWSDATDVMYTKEQVKDMFTRKFLPMDTPMGVIGKSTSSLSVDEMTEFLNKVQAYATSEWGISLLSAEDKMFDTWRRQYE